MKKKKPPETGFAALGGAHVYPATVGTTRKQAAARAARAFGRSWRELSNGPLGLRIVSVTITVEDE